MCAKVKYAGWGALHTLMQWMGWSVRCASQCKECNEHSAFQGVFTVHCSALQRLGCTACIS